MSVLSVDLASRRYADNGIAILRGSPGRVSAELFAPESLGLVGEPNADSFAAALVSLAEREQIRVMLLDGPQGWRAEESALQHQRLCERDTRTPGKTGLPGVVKPATWTRMADFSVALFDALHSAGWPRLISRWSGERATIESFPTHAWRMLGRSPLPAKSKRTDLAAWVSALGDFGLRRLPRSITHDQVQALVAGLGGIALLHGGLAACDLRGRDPFVERGTAREGFILSPRLGVLP